MEVTKVMHAIAQEIWYRGDKANVGNTNAKDQQYRACKIVQADDIVVTKLMQAKQMPQESNARHAK